MGVLKRLAEGIEDLTPGRRRVKRRLKALGLTAPPKKKRRRKKRRR